MPDRYKRSDKYKKLLDEFIALDADEAELCLDKEDNVTKVAAKMRAITYNTPGYTHIKVKVRWNNLYLVKEEL